MHQLLYAMHFRSQTSQLVDHSELVRTTGSATGCVVSTMIRASGVQTVLEPSAGDLAFFESELRVTGPDQFKEDGTITIGEDSEHLLRFSTLGHGHVARGPDPGTMAVCRCARLHHFYLHDQSDRRAQRLSMRIDFSA